jgi:glutamate dehydrogenase
MIINKIAQKLKENNIVVDFEYNNRPIIKIWSFQQLILRDVFYIFEDLHLILEKDEISIENFEDKKIYVSKYYFQTDDIEKVRKNLNSLLEVIKVNLVNPVRCQLYPLSYLENVSVRQMQLLRAIIIYGNSLKLLAFRPTVKAFLRNSKIAKEILNYFDCKFNYQNLQKDKSCQINLIKHLKDVDNLEDYKIFNLILNIIENMVRTNYFLDKDVISFKIETSKIDDLKSIEPNIETFVYHKDFLGVHLRMDKVSRGGLRHSDRDDFRNEVKSLMIAQDAKNSIIIPRGAKGGFKINDDIDITKEKFNEVYTIFINSILDLVDNIKDEKVIKNEKIISYDDDDTYLVVAADKGTSSMSDVANSIAISRDFWLKDAFASGGSNGYSHKDLGITAKGAIKSTQIFFEQKDIDIYKDSITIVGLGSMSGDVFGNGILESDKFKLIGAISSKEIFIDPNPDVQKSYQERKRLFALPKASWSDYNTDIISQGGGVFKRNEKFCKLSVEIQKLLNTSEEFLSGENLAKEILKLNVDMLFNGGVGTYFKASFEDNIEIGDKINQSLRIDAKDIKAFCVCEGGNLGFTQNARIEYAQNGGKISTDSIDNSAGVNISDYEVNIKILIKDLEDKSILKNITDDVISKVLNNNISQSSCLENDLVKLDKNSLIEILAILEKNSKIFRRKDLFIPSDEKIELLRPILAIVLSYVKLLLKSFILENIILDEKFDKFILDYFPKQLSDNFKVDILNHQLKNQIIATQMTSKIIDKNGILFIKDFENKDIMINNILNCI